MVRYFLTYATEAENEAAQVNDGFTEAGLGNASDSAPDDASAMRDADFLFAVLTSAEQIDDKSVRKALEFFDGEIRWGRKKDGEIIFIVSSDGVLSNLPLRFKKYGYYLVGEVADAAQYCEGKAREATEKKADKAAFPEVKQIKYTPAAETVKQPEFSVRAPSVPSFDGNFDNVGKSSAGKSKSSAQARAAGKKSAQTADPFDDAYRKMNAMRAAKSKKSSKKGTVAGVIFFIILIAAILVLFAVLDRYGFVSAVSPVFDGVTHEITPIFDGSFVAGKGANALQAAAQYGII